MSTSPLGAYLRDKRVASGKSLREVAKALSISHVYLGEVERGRRRLLPEKYWRKLAQLIPEISLEGLERMAAASEPIDPAAVEGRSREVVVALARALDEGNMSDEVANRLLEILQKERVQR